ncbi:MAG: PEP-CTERM sorting domain-containing protein [Brasilonema sp.]
MTLLKTLSIAAASSAAAFLALASFATDAAQAALFKLSFSGEANGYVIYDSDTPRGDKAYPEANIELYPEAVKEYNIDLGEYGVYKGTTANANVYFSRSSVDTSIPTSYEADVFGLEVRDENNPEATFLVDFYYQKDSFGGSFDLPTSLPSGALVDVRTASAPQEYNESLFRGSVTTRLEKIPEPTSSVALLGAGAWFILRRRQRQKTQLVCAQTCRG